MSPNRCASKINHGFIAFTDSREFTAYSILHMCYLLKIPSHNALELNQSKAVKPQDVHRVGNNIVTCISIARQRLGKHFRAKRTHARE
jgi:hypothetical protein